MPKGRTTKNYNKELLLNIVEGVLPSSIEAWGTVAERYKSASGEVSLRDPVGLRRFYLEKRCDRFKKHTGQSAPSAQIRRAQRIYEAIVTASNAGVYGGTSSNEDSSGEESSEQEGSVSSVLNYAVTAAPSNTSMAAPGSSPSALASFSSVASTGSAAASTSSVVTSSSAAPTSTKRPREGTKSKSCRNRPRSNIAGAFSDIAVAIRVVRFFA